MPNNEGWRGQFKGCGSKVIGKSDDWRIGTDHAQKDQSPYSNQFEHRLA
jgi:hypothetical protein